MSSKQACSWSSASGLLAANHADKTCRYRLTFSKASRTSVHDANGKTSADTRRASVRIFVRARSVLSRWASSADFASTILSVPQNSMNFASWLSMVLASSSLMLKSEESRCTHRSKCSMSSAARGCLVRRNSKPSSEWLVSMESTLSTQAFSRAICSALRMSAAGTQNGSGRCRCRTEGRFSTGGSYRSISSKTAVMKRAVSSASPGAAAGGAACLEACEGAAGRDGLSAQESSSSSAAPGSGAFGSLCHAFVAGRRTHGPSAQASSISGLAARSGASLQGFAGTFAADSLALGFSFPGAADAVAVLDLAGPSTQ
mmetsp:Transcript_60695/g.162456  ORF Transcript_60695/g.162456 Transcript_60695/m.162456 type:complete len:315 (-) Transcript_60695:258-1202(-)